MKRKTVLVTGGLGFIGSNLVLHLIKLNYFVIILDKKTYSSNLMNLKNIKRSQFKLIISDINNKLEISKIFKKYNPIGVFNLAAETHVDRSIDNPEIFVKSNVNGVLVLLEQLKKYKKRNRNIKFLHISTDEVYGDIPKRKTSLETDPYKPSSPYAASKASADHLVRSYYRTFKLPLIITNCCNNYGPKQFPEKLIPKLILNLIQNKKLPIYGKGINEREWIHVDDHCKALIKIFKKGKIGESYNIGSGDIVSNNIVSKRLIKLFKTKINKDCKSKIVFVKDRPGHDLRYALNSNKIKKLGWKKKLNLNKGLFLTIKWYLENTQWIKKINKKKYSNRLGLKL
jgi:dTDP-glucose 4,6-dehydratase